MTRCAGEGSFDQEAVQADWNSIRTHFVSTRRNKGMTQHSVARRIGVSRSMLARYESGTGKPGLDNFFAWADVLDYGVTIYRKQNR